MKVFILLAIIFFSWRVFSADYYYEGRYYNVDEYIQFQDNPNYQQYLNQKRAEAKKQRDGVDQYFESREKAAAAQEKSRVKHLEILANQPSEEDLVQQEVAHEKAKEAQLKKEEILKQQYLAKKDAEEEKRKPSRMIASVFDGDEAPPRKRVPLDKRKYTPKPKSPIQEALKRK